MREGDWKLIELYDSDAVELYNLAADVGERNNLAPQQTDRVARMRAALAAWRQEVGAAGNRPNHEFDPAAFRALYREVDAGRFDPAQARRDDWEKMWNWRKAMDAAPSATKGKAQ